MPTVPSASASPPRILVTGGSGFLGQHVLEALGMRGYRSVVSPSHSEYDLTSESEIRLLLRDARPDVVLHLAAVVGGIGANRERPAEFFYQNLVMGTQLMEHSRRAGVRKFVA